MPEYSHSALLHMITELTKSAAYWEDEATGAALAMAREAENPVAYDKYERKATAYQRCVEIIRAQIDFLLLWLPAEDARPAILAAYAPPTQQEK